MRIRLLPFLLLAAVGCARLPPPAAELPAVVPPDAGSDVTPYEEAVQRRLAGIRTIRASGVLEIETTGTPVRQLNLLLLIGPEGQVRARGNRAIGPVFFELVADRDRFLFTIPTRRQAYVGHRGDEEGETTLLTPRVLTEPLRVRLDPAGVRHLESVRGETILVETVPVGPNGDQAVTQRITFSPGTGRISRVVAYGPDGKRTLVTTFADYRQLPGTTTDDAFPFTVEIVRPSVRTRARVKFRQVTPNVDIPPETFDPTPPRGFAVLPASAFDPDSLQGDAADDA